jgi:hypothetical protein
MSARRARLCVLLAAALAVGYYYFWQARAAVGPFPWRGDKNGFYDLLARGFLGGHLYVPIQPSPALLALPNPWDPHVDDALRWQDMVLYGGRYYLYFGAAPAVLLFAPWRLATGNDLPEPFALAVLCFAAFLFSCGALLRVLDLAHARPRPLLLTFLFLALGICQSAPFLLNRAAVYEIAIASGYCCLAGGLFFFARGVGPGAPPWSLAAAGAMFGLAVASRPHLILAGAIALAALAVFHRRSGSRRFLLFALTWALVGIGIGVYNYQRFGNQFEFGFRYQLSGPGQNRIEIGWRNLRPGLYYMLLARPEFSGVFPWMRMVFRFPFDSAELHPLPPDYFVEPSAGALWLAPFLLIAPLLWIRRAKRPPEATLIVGVAFVAGLAVLLFLASTHLASQRYEVDFLPLLVFAAVATIAMIRSRAISVIACVLVAYGALANMALAVAGPYDDYLHNRPASYLKLARRFSPVAEHRPLLSPRIDLRLEARFADHAYREPVVTIGRSRYCYFLFAEWTSMGIRFVSKTDDSQQQYDIATPTAPVPIHLTYAPESGDIRVAIDGHDAIVHHAGMLVAAPSQVAVGENFADMGLTARRFTGQLTVLQKTVEERAK